jgi:hypothetical protein
MTPPEKRAVEALRIQVDRYGLALMMIAEGCENPKQLARDTLAKASPSPPSELRQALEPFAAFADPRNKIPENMPITQGSQMARRQLTMGDCYRARAALAVEPAPAKAKVDRHDRHG